MTGSGYKPCNKVIKKLYQEDLEKEQLVNWLKEKILNLEINIGTYDITYTEIANEDIIKMKKIIELLIN